MKFELNLTPGRVIFFIVVTTLMAIGCFCNTSCGSLDDYKLASAKESPTPIPTLKPTPAPTVDPCTDPYAVSDEEEITFTTREKRILKDGIDHLMEQFGTDPGDELDELRQKILKLE